MEHHHEKASGAKQFRISDGRNRLCGRPRKPLGFPLHKMGMNGGFAFLLLYLILVVFVGYVICLGELSLGRFSAKALWRI